MDIRKLQSAIVEGLQDVKGQNIVVFNTEHLSPLFERVVIASGTSNRQTKALAASVRDAVKASGFPVLRTEGETNGEWIIVDCGAAVVHLMQPSIREYYHLEEIWGDKPVKLKLDLTPTRLVKASEPDAPVKKAAAKKVATKVVAAKKTAAKTAVARKAVPRKIADDATPARAAARKVPVKRAATTGGVTRTVGVKAAPGKKTMSKTTVHKVVIGEPAKKPAAKKSTAVKTTRRPAAKKAAPRA